MPKSGLGKKSKDQNRKTLPEGDFEKRSRKEHAEGDFAKRSLSGQDKISLFRWGLLSFMCGWLFYRSLLSGVLLLPAAAYFYRKEKERREKRRLDRLRKQYAQGLEIYASALKAGYAAERAAGYTAGECRFLLGEDSEITRSWEQMCRTLAMSQTPEEGFGEMARQLAIPEAALFSQVFGQARRSSGNLIPIVADTCRLLKENSETQEEIETALRARELECSLMNAIPLFLGYYLLLTSPGYFADMYTGAAGRFWMSLCLAGYIAAYVLELRLLEAERSL